MVLEDFFFNFCRSCFQVLFELCSKVSPYSVGVHVFFNLSISMPVTEGLKRFCLTSTANLTQTGKRQTRTQEGPSCILTGFVFAHNPLIPTLSTLCISKKKIAEHRLCPVNFKTCLFCYFLI